MLSLGQCKHSSTPLQLLCTLYPVTVISHQLVPFVLFSALFTDLGIYCSTGVARGLRSDPNIVTNFFLKCAVKWVVNTLFMFIIFGQVTVMFFLNTGTCFFYFKTWLTYSSTFQSPYTSLVQIASDKKKSWLRPCIYYNSCSTSTGGVHGGCMLVCMWSSRCVYCCLLIRFGQLSCRPPAKPP